MVAIPNDKPNIPRIYVYKQNKEGETEAIIVDVHTAVKLVEHKGWKLSTYEFLAKDKQNETVEMIINGICQDLNKHLNLHLEQDKQEVVKFAKRYLDYVPNPKMSRGAMIRKVEQVGRKQGKWFQDDYTVLQHEEVEEE